MKEAREIFGNFEADVYQEFLLEAHTIHDLQHDNITSLYGVRTCRLILDKSIAQCFV